MPQWNLEVHEDTDRTVRQYLQDHHGDPDLAAFVERAVKKAIFWDTVTEIQDRNSDLTPDEAEALANEAVAEARADSTRH